MKRILIGCFLLTSLASALAQPETARRELPAYAGLEELATLVILAEGRYKPLDSWAWETVRGICGRLRYQNYDQLTMLLDMTAVPDDWYDEPLLRIDHRPLRQALEVDPTRKYFSYAEIRGAAGLEKLLQELHSEEGSTLGSMRDYAQRLYGQLLLCSDLLTGYAFTLVPDLADEQAAWSSPGAPRNLEETATATLRATWNEMLAAWQQRDGASFNSCVSQLRAQLDGFQYANRPTRQSLEREVFYNHFRPFRKAITVYLLLILTGLLGLFFRQRFLYWLNGALHLIGLLLHSWGLYFITLIAGRAPLSNLYESLIFIIWGFVLIAWLFNFKYREHYVSIITGLLGFIAMVLAHQTAIDITINPLVPVLRSSWLIFHVTIILISYSAFGLAMGLGHIWLIGHRFLPDKTDLRRQLTDFTYRVLQLGIVTLAAGIILGAMWANESWGRYWGWDPKETWSLITLLFYLGVVHARARGWVRQRGMAILAVVVFASVIMTYYGVNHFLTGLHSYAGGAASRIPPLLLVYIAFETVFLLFTAPAFKLLGTQPSSNSNS